MLRYHIANVNLNGEDWTVQFGSVPGILIAPATENACQMPPANVAMDGLELPAIFPIAVAVLLYSVLGRAFAITW